MSTFGPDYQLFEELAGDVAQFFKTNKQYANKQWVSGCTLGYKFKFVRKMCDQDRLAYQLTYASEPEIVINRRDWFDLVIDVHKQFSTDRYEFLAPTSAEFASIELTTLFNFLQHKWLIAQRK